MDLPFRRQRRPLAQLVIVALPTVAPDWVEELPPSERGEGGFGSTGRA